MQLKEFLNTTPRGASNLGNSTFRVTLDKEQVLTPHNQMNRVLNMLENRPYVASGLRQHVRFLLNDISFHSNDTKTVDFLNEWFEQRPGLNDEIFKFAYMLVGAGTSYMEPTHLKFMNGGKVLDNLFAVPDPSIMYRNLDAKDDSEYWLMRLPILVRNFNGEAPKYRPVYYIRGAVFYRELIWCIAYPKDKYVCETFGWSRTPFYGEGLLWSAVDNADVEEEILKNWALQAKFRSIGKKVIGFYNENNEPISPQELEGIRQDFMNLEEEDSLITNKRFDQADLSFAGKDEYMDNQIQFLRKDTGSALVPNYMSANSQDHALGTAAEAKVPFSLELKAEQFELVKILNRIIIGEMRKGYKWLAKDATIVLGTPELYGREVQFNNTLALYNNRAATFNELRVAAGYKAVEGGDAWGESVPLDKLSIKVDPAKQNAAPTTMKENLKEFKEGMKFEEMMLYSPTTFISPTSKNKVEYEPKDEESIKKSREKQLKEALKKIGIMKK